MKLLKSLFIVLIASFLLPQAMTAQDHPKGNMGNHEMEKMEQYDASQDFQKQLKEVFASYIDLKDAMVASDAGQATDQAREMAGQLKKVDGSGLDGDAGKMWMKWSGALQKGLGQIQSEKDLRAQRTAFADVSDAMYHSIKSFGVKDLDAYYQFCPMAKNGEGAHWMSEEEAIKNPYYGSKMMKCGKTVEEL